MAARMMMMAMANQRTIIGTLRLGIQVVHNAARSLTEVSSKGHPMTMNNVRSHLREIVGASEMWSHGSSHAQPRGSLPKSQTELPARRMRDSLLEVELPLGRLPELREKYINMHGGVRFGRILEELDTFAILISYQHTKKEGSMRSPLSIVTAMVDKIVVKETIAAHSGDLEAAEAACAELMVDEDSTPSPVPYSSSKGKGKRGHDDDELLQSLQKRVHESGELLKALAQPQSITATVAYTNYMRDILLSMSKTNFRKARSGFNKILSVLLDEDSDVEEVPTAHTVPARASVRTSTATAMQQPLQSRHQQQQAQCQPMMPPPPHHGFQQTPRVSTEQPNSASACADIGSAAQEPNQSPSDLDTSSQSFFNISGFSGMLNLSSDPIAASTPCVELNTPEPLQNFKSIR